MSKKYITSKAQYTPWRMASHEKVQIAYQMHDIEGMPFETVCNILGYGSAASARKAVWRYRRTLATQAPALSA